MEDRSFGPSFNCPRNDTPTWHIIQIREGDLFGGGGFLLTGIFGWDLIECPGDGGAGEVAI